MPNSHHLCLRDWSSSSGRGTVGRSSWVGFGIEYRWCEREKLCVFGDYDTDWEQSSMPVCLRSGGYRGLSVPRLSPLRLIDLYVCFRTFWMQLSLSLTVLVIVFVLDRVP